MALTRGRVSIRELHRWGRVLARVGQEMQEAADQAAASMTKTQTPRRVSRRSLKS